MKKETLLEGKEKLIHNIKLVLYKKNPDIFNDIDFENNLIFSDPLIFAGINSKFKPNLNHLLWGYKSHYNPEDSLKVITDEKGIFYIANIGYFYTQLKTTHLLLSFSKNTFVLRNNNLKTIPFDHKSCFKIHDKFEVLTHQNNLLKEHIYDDQENVIDVEVTETTLKQFSNFLKALDIIRDNSPGLYSLIELCVRKFLIFKSDSYIFKDAEIIERNSFATLSVHGCAFFNAFRENYNEVFFIEDIAHQCGHIIFNTYLASEPKIYTINPKTNIATIEEVEDYNETRSLFVVHHAMYTYDCILNCFYDCLINQVFKNDKHKEHELIGRIIFTLNKFVKDFELISQRDNNGVSLYFNESGMLMLEEYLKTFKKITNKFSKVLLNINLNGQPYNFSYNEYLKNNPIKQNEII
jgi:hypothetical protein